VAKKKSSVQTTSETHRLKGRRKGALLKEQVWFEDEKVVAYSLAYINLRRCSADNGRVLATITATITTIGTLWERSRQSHLRLTPPWLSDSSLKSMNCGGSKMKKSKVTIKTSSTDEFFHRVRERAEKLDRGETLPAEITISFEDPMELLSILTSERVRLLRRAKGGSLPISDLADGLKRDVRAVSRDVVVLEKAGLLRTSYRVNPGHGRLKIVEALARGYKLTANL
jgi:predicted transcriptional regulator